MEFLCVAITIYLVILLARAVMSWFPPGEPGSFSFSVARILHDLTEPLLGPVRRIVPPAGMFDLSFIVVVIGLVAVQAWICR